jgi:hypothetical protein
MLSLRPLSLALHEATGRPVSLSRTEQLQFSFCWIL